MSHEERLRDAEIEFHTLDKKKKRYTLVTVNVQDRDHRTVALVSGPFGRFGDDTQNGPFNLNIINRVKRNEVQGGNINIGIDPVEGNDDWRFNLKLGLWFEGDSTDPDAEPSLKVEEPNIYLDEHTSRDIAIP